jgi:uncharacterized protein (DUF2164 family)
MAVKLPDDVAEKAVASLRRYFDVELEEELGDLRGRLLLEFILEEIGPSIYNAAIADAQTYFRDRVSDLEGACYEPEFGFWTKKKGARGGR